MVGLRVRRVARTQWRVRWLGSTFLMIPPNASKGDSFEKAVSPWADVASSPSVGPFAMRSTRRSREELGVLVRAQ